MENAIAFLESKGFEFEKDKDDLWMEESVGEMKWKDFFEFMQDYQNKLKNAAEKYDQIEKDYWDTLEQNDACEFGLFVCRIVNPHG